MVAVDVVIIAAVALLAVLVAGLLRSNAELTRALHHLGVDLGPDCPGIGRRDHPGEPGPPADPGRAPTRRPSSTWPGSARPATP